MTVTTEATHSDWDGRLVRYPQDRAQHYLQSGSWSSLPTSRRFRDIAVRYPDRPAVISGR